jgi:hypothetical protein
MVKEELYLQVSADKLLRKIFHFRKGELSGELGTLCTGNFVICAGHLPV